MDDDARRIAQIWQGLQGARTRIAGAARRTPVLRSRTLDGRLGATVHFKCENLQRTGSFKFRGAYHALSRLDAAARQRGVITYSSGNHAQALAAAGRLLGIAVTVVMPSDAPAVKRAATAGYGAEIVSYDPAREQREPIGRKLAEDRGSTLIPPYDHPDVIAGQGTVAAELFEEVPDLDLLLVPTGGAGLLSGCAVAARHLAPACRVIGIEPALADDATRSFRSGVLQQVERPQTIADGLRTPALGEHTFPLVRSCVHDMQTVSEAAIGDAVRYYYYRMKLVVEPSGAVSLAALLSGAVAPAGRIGIIVSGGNVDAATMAALLQESHP
jgi:threo-3-hydroxy-L-aspartate ammonia-lyase